MTSAFSFYGVSTASSSIMELFPLWAAQLDLGDVEIVGTDLPIGAPAGAYRSRVAQLRSDPDEIGALITTHKIDLFESCRDQFDEIDPLAALCEEASCLSKRGDRLRAHAKDPISAGRTLDAMLAPDHFRSGAEVLCLGAGGAAIAIALHLLGRRAGDRPRRMVVSDPRADRLDALRRILERAGAAHALRCVPTPPSGAGDALLAELADGSLVVNATGMGKDLPGSPLRDGASFPAGGIVWELNYRGELEFLHQARTQAEQRKLAVHDGWVYFVHGWTAVIEEVFDRPITTEELAALVRLADDVRDRRAHGTDAPAPLSQRRTRPERHERRADSAPTT